MDTTIISIISIVYLLASGFAVYIAVEIIAKEEKPFPLWKFLLLVMVSLLASIVLIVIIPPAFAWETLRNIKNWGKKKEKKEEGLKINFDRPGLFFHRMGGVGQIHCRDCEYTEEIISLIHGLNEEGGNWFREGTQCQSCGKFHFVDNDELDEHGKPSYQCECGGQLERWEPLFCPQCKSMRLRYWMEYMT
jgi:hypothetical protein